LSQMIKDFESVRGDYKNVEKIELK